MKGTALFQGKIIKNCWKLCDIFQQSSSQTPFRQKRGNLCESVFRYCRFKLTFVQITITRGRVVFRKGAKFLHNFLLKNDSMVPCLFFSLVVEYCPYSIVFWLFFSMRSLLTQSLMIFWSNLYSPLAVFKYQICFALLS